MAGDPNKPLDRRTIELLILAAAPEREAELREIWKKYDPVFSLLPDRKGITLQARGQRVEFDNKTLAAFWLLGFAAWKIFVCHSPHLILSLASNKPIDAKMFGVDKELPRAEAAFEEMLYTIRDILQAKSLDEITWSSGAPKPQSDKKGMDIDQQAAFDLIMIATAYAFLHEIRHIMFNKDGGAPSRPQEEITCDTFARNFLLDKINKYAASSREDPKKVLLKRAMGLALGSFIIQQLTPRADRSGTTEYPPVADRLDVLIGQIQTTADNDFWIFAGALLMAVLRTMNRSINIDPQALPTMCRNLIEEIRKRS